MERETETQDKDLIQSCLSPLIDHSLGASAYSRPFPQMLFGLKQGAEDKFGLLSGLR